MKFPFEEALHVELKRNHILPFDEQVFRRGWNSAIMYAIRLCETHDLGDEAGISAGCVKNELRGAEVEVKT
jgi:hypothetical protein